MRYTVHAGRRQDPWPPQLGEASTREAAQRAAVAALEHRREPQVTKAEVRLNVLLLDCYGRQPDQVKVRHVYAFKQRAATTGRQLDLATEEDES